jgi:septal ring-binding cell division protein DamX
MRFEIKSGGVVAILLGVAALSFAVFMLGLLAGYDVGRESQSSAAQVATSYPVTPPPAGAPSAAQAAATPGNAVAAAPESSPAAEAAVSPIAAPPVSASAPVAAVATAKPLPKHLKPSHSTASAIPPSERMSAEAPPPASAMDTPSDEDDATSASDNDTESAAPPAPAPRAAATAVASAHAPARHKPYTIQIQAAMDHNGASEMIQRLQALGYPSHMVPAQLNGQTWYKVVIGPYATQEEAAAAQQQMRTKYNSLYNGSSPGPPSSGSSD